MASYNRIVLVGNLTRDPEHKTIGSGQSVCRLSLATNRQFKNRQNGAPVQEVCYIDVDVWGAQADSCKQYLQKGRPILVEGRLKLDTWQDTSGSSRSKHSVVADRVVFLGAGGAVGMAEESDGLEDDSHGAPQSLRGGDLALNPANKVEKDLMDQLEKAEKKVKAVRASTQKTAAVGDLASTMESVFGSASTGEFDFKDQPPFEDNPF